MAGRHGSLPANAYSFATRFPTQKSAVDHELHSRFLSKYTYLSQYTYTPTVFAPGPLSLLFTVDFAQLNFLALVMIMLDYYFCYYFLYNVFV